VSNRAIHRELLTIGDCTDRPLEEYLRALWRLGGAAQDLPQLPAELFVDLLRRATVEQAPAFDDAWRTADFGVTESMAGFEVWERVILSQIADLRDLDEGTSDAEAERDGGVVRACGTRWHHRTVAAFLECGTAGALPGEAVPDALTWPEFTEFLVCGQEYE